jgi:hypothetical protein
VRLGEAEAAERRRAQAWRTAAEPWTAIAVVTALCIESANA